MQKKKIILLVAILSVILSTILFYDKYFSASGFERITNGDRFIVWTVTTIIIIYYVKLDSDPQLAPLALSSDKEGSKKNNNKIDISFKNVAGLEEIKEELKETIDFINNSQKYTKMGAKIPKGILFYGPPGTGKTLLAKAVAGETNSTFLYASGSEFVEKYVGVGAKRVRSLFEKAKKDSPSIIFIDEIDAIGARRNLDSNNEKDQTLNQLLSEMDGFNTSETVVVIGATNRLDLLDEALLRPGRFDRHIYVGNPNINAREKILQVHTKNKPLHNNVSVKELANKTHGLSGAQLANIANEAAIIAVRNRKNKIDNKDFNQAIERVLAGLEIKNPSVLLKEKKTIAIHEAGHALVSKILKTDMVQKVSIVPRGQALGYVLKFPEEERYLYTHKELMDKITGLLAGRAAEQIIFKDITTGAKDDLTKATEIAQEMVCSYGMSTLGNISIDEYYIKNNYDIIRREIKKIMDKCFKNALKIVEDNKIILFQISDLLMKQETINNKELDKIFEEYKTKLDYAT